MSTTDQVLVEQSLTGDHDAFAEIVRRYQTLLCSVAYGATGNFTTSEELAQEAFVSAWNSIAELREPGKLRQWLCGITRNLANSRTRRQQRDLLGTAGSLDHADATEGTNSDPADATIANEEIELLNRTLATMPADYREPMVLFYREDQSVARVAELLELSTDNVKQRLSRGRKMLREEVAAVVARGLRQSAPGRAFTVGVLSALPVMSSTAQAATITAATAKGAAAANAGAWTAIAGAIAGPILGLLGSWFGYSMSMKAADSEEERNFIRRISMWMFVWIVVMTVSLAFVLIVGSRAADSHPMALAVGIIGLVLTHVSVISFMVVWGNRRLSQLRREHGNPNPIPAEVAAKLPAALGTFQYPRTYESKARLLGLPLISVRFEGASNTREAAKGWIAIGDFAYGVLFASGSVAVGGIAIGAVGIGLVSLGGLAVGGLALGGCALGWMSVGGAAAGWLVFGGMAVGWRAAMGGLSVAHDYAIGGLAIGEHANDDLAKAYLANSSFFQAGELMMTPWSWWILMAVAFLPMFAALRLVKPTKTQDRQSREATTDTDS